MMGKMREDRKEIKTVYLFLPLSLLSTIVGRFLLSGLVLDYLSTFVGRWQRFPVPTQCLGVLYLHPLRLVSVWP